VKRTVSVPSACPSQTCSTSSGTTGGFATSSRYRYDGKNNKKSKHPTAQKRNNRENTYLPFTCSSFNFQLHTPLQSNNKHHFVSHFQTQRKNLQKTKLGFQIAVMALFSRVKSGISLCNKLGLLSSQRSTLQRSLIAPSISQVNKLFSISISYQILSLFLSFSYDSLNQCLIHS
jgi:hypothetical protein